MRRIVLLASAVFLGAAAFVTLPATDLSAQTAKNLKCNGCVGKKDLGKKSVTKKAIANKAVTKKAIANQAITSNAIKDGAVSAAKLSDGAVTAAKLSDGAKPGGVAEAEGFGEIVVINDITDAISVSIDAPSDGFALVTASGIFTFEGADAEVGICMVTDGLAMNEEEAVATTVPDDTFAAFAQTRVLSAVAGTNTYRLLCDTDAPADSLGVMSPVITALFVPVDISSNP